MCRFRYPGRVRVGVNFGLCLHADFPMSDLPFRSLDHFRQLFSSGLRALLQDPGLGGYILVHANAGFESELMDVLRSDLLRAYQRLAQTCREAFRCGREVGAGADDVSVFLKLLAIGFEGVQTTRFRDLGDWELQFNHLRAFRPTRMTGERVGGISRPFDPQGFHFNKPFLSRERFWAGELLGEEVHLLYNKFPFVPLHGLLVPQPAAQRPQLLTRQDHDYIWRLCETLGERLPGFAVGYNSYGACASVNHLHFQTFVREAPLPIAGDNWTHRGGPRAYPVNCTLHRSSTEAWRQIECLHGAATPYNLIYLPGSLYCVPRRAQGSYDSAPWSGGFAWYELAGGFVTPSADAFEALDAPAITREMAKLDLPDRMNQLTSSQSSR